MLARRGLLLGLLATPAIIRSPGLLMPISRPKEEPSRPNFIKVTTIGRVFVAGDTLQLTNAHETPLELWTGGEMDTLRPGEVAFYIAISTNKFQRLS